MKVVSPEVEGIASCRFEVPAIVIRDTQRTRQPGVYYLKATRSSRRPVRPGVRIGPRSYLIRHKPKLPDVPCLASVTVSGIKTEEIDRLARRSGKGRLQFNLVKIKRV
jgi:hypothetical protein